MCVCICIYVSVCACENMRAARLGSNGHNGRFAQAFGISSLGPHLHLHLHCLLQRWERPVAKVSKVRDAAMG